MPDIELPDHLVDRLCGLPHGPTGPAARAKLERAINRALDAEHWPRGERGDVAVPCEHYFVNLWDRHGRLKGHVGPVHAHALARQVAESWRKAGYSSRVDGIALGRALTNDYGP